MTPKSTRTSLARNADTTFLCMNSSFAAYRCVETGRRWPARLPLELVDRAVRLAEAAAQLAAEVGEELDGDGSVRAREPVEHLLGQHVAHQLFVRLHRRRARLAVEQRHLAEHGARREGREPVLAPV